MAHHPQCDGMIERLKCTFKTELQKQAVKFGTEQDIYIPTESFVGLPLHSVYFCRRSYLQFGYGCQLPTEAALLSATTHQPININDYQEELVVTPSLARKMANQEVQHHYKCHIITNINMISHPPLLLNTRLVNGVCILPPEETEK